MSSDDKRQGATPPGQQRPHAGGRPGPRRGRKRSPRRELAPARAVEPHMQALLETPIEASRFIVFDIETTGGNPEKNGITEIFAIKYEQGEVKETFYSLVNPCIPIPPIVRRMTGINNQMVRDAPKIEAVMPGFIAFAGQDVLVSHNTIGDMKFIRHFAKKCCDVDFDNFFLCTHLLVEKLVSEAPDKSLKGLSNFFELYRDMGRGELHRAEADAYLTLELFKVLVARLEQRSVRRIDEAIRLQGDLESGMRLGWGIKQLEEPPVGAGLFRLYDHEKKLLFLSSALQLDREVAKLRSFVQLPRQLLRLVLRTYDMNMSRSANSYAAMLEECEALESEKVNFYPVDWHQRSIHVLHLVERPLADGRCEARLDLGPIEEGTCHAFGPVRDRRIAGEYLGAIGAAIGVKHQKHGLILDEEQKPLVLALLQGQLQATYEDMVRRRRSLKLWFKPTERKSLSRHIQMMRRLLQIKSRPRLEPMLDRSGVLVLPDKLASETQGTVHWQIYQVALSRPQGVQTVQSTIKGTATWTPEMLADSGLAERLHKMIKDDEARLNQRPLSRLEASQANATLWWIYNSRSEGLFLPVDELRTLK